jgi:hypothetical protein
MLKQFYSSGIKYSNLWVKLTDYLNEFQFKTIVEPKPLKCLIKCKLNVNH